MGLKQMHKPTTTTITIYKEKKKSAKPRPRPLTGLRLRLKRKKRHPGRCQLKTPNLSTKLLHHLKALLTLHLRGLFRIGVRTSNSEEVPRDDRRLTAR